MRAVEQRVVELAEFDCCAGIASLRRRFGWLPVVDGDVIEHGQTGTVDSGKCLAAQGGEGLAADAEHRQ
ncbi:hypothetical protein D3C84_1270370 [compost metagenome]